MSFKKHQLSEETTWACRYSHAYSNTYSTNTYSNALVQYAGLLSVIVEIFYNYEITSLH